MFDTHHVGGFIQNTMKPMIEEINKVLARCENIQMTKIEVQQLLDQFVTIEIIKTFVYCITYLLLGGMLCGTIYFILH